MKTNFITFQIVDQEILPFLNFEKRVLDESLKYCAEFVLKIVYKETRTKSIEVGL